jgi:hypothetical protein
VSGPGIGCGDTPLAARIPAVSPEIAELCERLERISEDLADLAIHRLRESIDAGGTELPVDEKLITRARRSVEKACSLLRSTDAADDDSF